MRLAITLLVFAAAANAEQARLDYMLHCMGCHRIDGGGMPPEVPRVAGTVGRYLDLPEGRRYLIQVPGASQSLLNDAALARVLNWMLLEFGDESLPEDFLPYTEAEVRRYRRNVPDDVDALRRRLASELVR